jgi:protein TonB
MFEQSILLDGDTAKKTRVFFASVSAQIAAVCVLLLIPLIYTETLPVIQLPFTLPMPLPQPAAPVENVRPVAQASRPSVFHIQFRVPSQPAAAASPAETQIDSFAPPVAGSLATLPMDLGQRLIRIDRPVEIPGPPAASAKPAFTDPTAAGPVRVSSELQAAKIIKKVVPQYPVLARQARISGTVKLMGIIAKDGTVQKLQVISGHPLLQKAALDAVSQWRYQPTILSGQPVEVIAPIDVIFTLTQ